jgi:hypothetical protein
MGERTRRNLAFLEVDMGSLAMAVVMEKDTGEDTEENTEKKRVRRKRKKRRRRRKKKRRMSRSSKFTDHFSVPT